MMLLGLEPSLGDIIEPSSFCPTQQGTDSVRRYARGGFLTRGWIHGIKVLRMLAMCLNCSLNSVLASVNVKTNTYLMQSIGRRN